MNFLRPLTCCAGLALASADLSAIVFQFDYTYDTQNFFSGPNEGRRAYLEAAALVFEPVLIDSLTAINPTGPNTYTQSFLHPGTGGTATATDVFVAADTVLVYAGGQALAGNTLGQGGPGGFSASGFSSFFSTLARGQGTVSGETATDFGRWGGSITFDNDRSWYFDDDVSTMESTGGLPDFYSVAVHELAHLLGFGTADSWDNLVDGSNFFQGSVSVAIAQGAVSVNNTGHWAEGTMSETIFGNAQEAAMDPTILQGTRKYFTLLDYAGLDDLGWELNWALIPEPRSTGLLAGLAVLGLAWRRRQMAR